MCLWLIPNVREFIDFFVRTRYEVFEWVYAVRYDEYCAYLAGSIHSVLKYRYQTIDHVLCLKNERFALNYRQLRERLCEWKEWLKDHRWGWRVVVIGRRPEIRLLSDRIWHRHQIILRAMQKFIKVHFTLAIVKKTTNWLMQSGTFEMQHSSCRSDVSVGSDKKRMIHSQETTLPLEW